MTEIYEAQDLGFSSTETQKLFDADSKIVDKIVSDLKTIFPDRKIEKHYL